MCVDFLPGVKYMIKIVGGEFRGRNLLSVPGEATRPPLAKVRAAVANILVEYLDGAAVLDLFAGTGSYSFELLSRGALSAVCVDKNPKAIQILRKNAAILGIAGRVQIIQGDALKTMGSIETSRKKFLIAVVAPPYFLGLDQKAMEGLGSSLLLEPGGIAVLQQHKKEQTLESYGVLELRKTYSYGETKISTYLPRWFQRYSFEPKT